MSSIGPLPQPDMIGSASSFSAGTEMANLLTNVMSQVLRVTQEQMLQAAELQRAGREAQAKASIEQARITLEAAKKKMEAERRAAEAQFASAITAIVQSQSAVAAMGKVVAQGTTQMAQDATAVRDKEIQDLTDLTQRMREQQQMAIIRSIKA